MIELENYIYEDDDIISDTIINFCKNNKATEKFVNKYINDNKFNEYIKKNFLITKICEKYLTRLYNDYEEDNVVEEYDYITSVNPTRWI